jgi:hypothetical protein
MDRGLAHSATDRGDDAVRGLGRSGGAGLLTQRPIDVRRVSAQTRFSPSACFRCGD